MVTTENAATAVETLKQATENENEEMELNAAFDATKEPTACDGAAEGETDEGQNDSNEDSNDVDDRFAASKALLEDDNNAGEIDDNNSDDENVTANENGPKLKASSKNIERGIVYLSSIPTAMDLQQIRAALSNCGKLGRVFLQEDHKSQKKRAKRTYYSEGWVEFKNKKDAKRAAKMLNCSQVGGKKRHPWFSDTWHIKYLPRFKWHHLVDRLAYERAVEEQKMRIEVGAARKEAHHFRELADKADGDKRTVKKGKDINRREWKFYQKQSEEEIKGVIEKKSQKSDNPGSVTKKGKRKTEHAAGEGGRGGGAEKRTKREVMDEKKTKKRELIKSIFQGGDSDDE